jgi:hypothetical protein
VNVAAPLQTRVVVLLGLVAAALLAFVVLRPALTGSDATTATRTPVAKTPAPATKPATPGPAAQRAAKARPRVVLVDGLPAGVARALRKERVVVAALFAPGGRDLAAVEQARTGARETGAGFAAVNVLREGNAGAVEKLVGAVSAPSVLVFKRPGKVVFRFEGYADATTVAQAAHDAGARSAR